MVKLNILIKFYGLENSWRFIFMVFMQLLVKTALSQVNPFYSYSAHEDLPSQIIYDGTQDKDGKLWFLTQSGVMTYDGFKWQIMPDSLNLPSSAYSEIIMLEGERLIIAGINNNNERLIAIRSNSEWRYIDVPGSSSMNERYFVLKKNSDLKIVVSTRNKLQVYSFKDNTWRDIPLNNLHYRSITNVLEIYDKEVIITTKGMFFIEGNKSLAQGI